MSNFDATTPQLSVVKNLVDAYSTFDFKNIKPFLSKDFKFQTLPKVPELPDQTMEEHIEMYAPFFSSFTKLEVTYHEVIDAPGRVILHVSTVAHTVDGNKLEYDTLSIFSLVEEDGELKISELRDFCDPEKRSKNHSWGAKALTKAGPAA